MEGLRIFRWLHGPGFCDSLIHIHFRPVAFGHVASAIYCFGSSSKCYCKPKGIHSIRARFPKRLLAFALFYYRTIKLDKHMTQQMELLPQKEMKHEIGNEFNFQQCNEQGRGKAWFVTAVWNNCFPREVRRGRKVDLLSLKRYYRFSREEVHRDRQCARINKKKDHQKYNTCHAKHTALQTLLRTILNYNQILNYRRYLGHLLDQTTANKNT